MVRKYFLWNCYNEFYSYLEPFSCNGQSKFLKVGSGHPSWSGNPENTFAQKADPNLGGGVCFISCIHISNRWAIITMRSFCGTHPPHSTPVPVLANAFHEFAYIVGKPSERDACPSLPWDNYSSYGACIVLVWDRIIVIYTKNPSP